jgi:dTDP-4-dehydrorhamnose 3,5-epimerase-like enzyme
MAYLIDLQSFIDKRGNLTVIEKTVPFGIKRIFYIYGVDGSSRGGHRHKRTVQAAICIQGSCSINNHDGSGQATFLLNRPDKCLIIEPADWHTMELFSPDAILMILASEYFDQEDYIFESYAND